ncbi:unnamed protein product, partial [marine sediment metagenome]
CNFTINNTVYSNTTDLANGSEISTLNVTFIDGGEYFWNTTCADTNNNVSFTPDTWNFTIVVSELTPSSINVTILTPANNTDWANTTMLNFTGSVDTAYPVDHCNFTINYTEYQNTSVTGNGTQTFGTNVTFIEAGVYWWNSTCLDDNNNQSTSGSFNFTINETYIPPIGPNSSINLSQDFPLNDSYWVNGTRMEFNWSVNSTYDIVDCNLTIEADVYQNTTNLGNGSTAGGLNVTLFWERTYIWKVMCADSNG